MVISPSSGSMQGQAARASSPAKATVIAQENEDRNSMKAGIDNQKIGAAEDEKKMESIKGIQKVDTVI